MHWPWSRKPSVGMARAAPLRLVGHRVDRPERGFQLDATFTKEGSLEAPDDLLSLLKGLSSDRISRSAALSVPAVLRARNLIAGIPSTLPIEIHDRSFRVDERNSIVTEPDPDLPASIVFAFTFEDLLFEAVSYWQVTRFGADGIPLEARHVNLRSVSQHAILGMPSEIINDDLLFSPRDPVFIDGLPVPRREVVRFVSPNPPLLKHAARAIRVLLCLDRAAEIYATDPLPLGYFTDREDADPLDDEEVQEVLDQWAAMRQKRAFGFVPNSLEAKTLSWDATKIQLAEARQHAVLEIARATGLQSLDLAVDSSTSHTYNTPEHRRLDLLTMTLMPLMTAVEQRLSMNDVLPRGLSARFDASGFLRGDLATRMGAFKTAREIGAMTDEEMRRAERKPPLTVTERSRINSQPPQAPDGVNGNGRVSVSPNGSAADE